MTTSVQTYIADHRRLLEVAGLAAGFAEPIAFDPDVHRWPLLQAARKGPIAPVDGALVRDWDPHLRNYNSGVRLGIRRYTIQNIPFVRVRFHLDGNLDGSGLDFFVVERRDYIALYRVAKRLDETTTSEPPILPQAQLDILWKNTIGYLDAENLERIRGYGGRPKRGLLLTGTPGNGKTMACRWIWEECARRRWEYRLVTPDSYRAARRCGEVQSLFSVAERGVVFFDDMDLALRDREQAEDVEDQAVFLGALDGIKVTEGVVFVFTTNCPLDRIDRAFKRPGRIDVVLQFESPAADLRRKLVERWHADIRRGIDLDEAVAATDGYSFAEIDELKNLLVLRYLDVNAWDWDWAMEQFTINRSEFIPRPHRHVGFCCNGDEVHDAAALSPS